VFLDNHFGHIDFNLHPFRCAVVMLGTSGKYGTDTDDDFEFATIISIDPECMIFLATFRHVMTPMKSMVVPR
jgi:hypothetical protein